MAKALMASRDAEHRAGRNIDWSKKVSDHVAFGLLIYTGLQIFLTLGALKSGHGSIIPYFALVVLVAAIVPACRFVEMRWERLVAGEADDAALAPRFQRDMALVWLGAIGLPVLLTFFFKGLAAIF